MPSVTLAAPPPALAALADLMAQGHNPAPPDGAPREALLACLRERYPQRSVEQAEIRDPYGRGRGEPTHIPFAGVIPEGSSPSGAYGGMSLVWFPRPSGGSLLTLVVGTLGLLPDEAILARPGHRRHVAAMRAHLRRLGVTTWTKPDPAAIAASAPPGSLREAFPAWDDVLHRYGAYIYACAEITEPGPAAAAALQAFVDLYAYERGWQPLAAHRSTVDGYLAGLDAEVFRSPTEDELTALLLERRFLVLQGPPGTGKTRTADRIGNGASFRGRRLPVQFHPAVTYEDFVIGLSPDASAEGLRFRVRPGWLLQAVDRAEAAAPEPFLLQIDEINRGDLAKVLGEAIYLFEPGEVGGQAPRAIALPHPWADRPVLRLPPNLYVLGTMNTADRSIAGMDLAVRRRFAFATLHPDRAPVAAQPVPLAATVFDRLAHVFVEHASDEAFALLPGHAFYLAGTEAELRRRLRYELIPLLDEYLAAGVLGAAAPEVQGARDWLADILAS